MTVPITGSVKDVTGVEDNDTPWSFASVIRFADDGSVITEKPREVRAVSGNLKVNLVPGYAIVTYGKQVWQVTVPETATTLKALIEAGVAFPPDTSQALLDAAVGQYVETHREQFRTRAVPITTGPDAGKLQWYDENGAEVGGPTEAWTVTNVSTEGISDAEAVGKEVVRSATKEEARSAISAAALTEGSVATWTEIADKQARPTNPGVVAIGDSITANNYHATAWTGTSYSRTSSYLAMGYLNCAMVWNRQPATWWGVGINGQTSAQGLSRFDTDVTPLNPQVVIEAFATNDIFTDRTAAQVFSDKLAMWGKAWGFGAKVISATCPPRDTFTATQEQEANKLNALLREFAATNPTNFALVDWYAVLADPVTGNFKAGYAPDGVHPLTAACWQLGKAFEAALDRFIPATSSNLAAAAVNDAGNLLSYPLMTDSGGLILTDKGLSGTLASGWYAGSSGSDATLTSVLSTVSRADGYGNWQQINTTVVPAATSTVTLNQNVSTGWAVGDIVQAYVEFETDAAGWANGKFDLNLSALDASNVCYSNTGTFNSGDDAVVEFRPEQGILQTPPIVIPELTTKLTVTVTAGGLGVARFGRAALRRLASA